MKRDNNHLLNSDTASDDQKKPEDTGVSRRAFIGLLAAGVASSAVVTLEGCAPGNTAGETAGALDSSASLSGTAESGNLEGSSGTPSQTTALQTQYKIIDNHIHYLDFIQQSQGLEDLVQAMDEAGVPHAVLFGMAMAKQWDEDADNVPAYYLSNDSRTYYYSATDFIMMERLQAATEEQRKRFFPFVCGINPNDRFAAQKIRQALDIYPNQFAGIGELMSRHDDLTALTYGEPPHLDHPAFLEIFDLGAEEGLPILIHHNIAAAYVDDPIYLDELKIGLAHNREAKIILAHVGVSRRVELSNLIEIAEQLLQENENLWFDLSWVVFDDYINKSAQSLEQWAELLERYPTKFMIGSDAVGHWENYVPTIQRYYALLDLLSPETAELVCQENIMGLIKTY